MQHLQDRIRLHTNDRELFLNSFSSFPLDFNQPRGGKQSIASKLINLEKENTQVKFLW